MPLYIPKANSTLDPNVIPLDVTAPPFVQSKVTLLALVVLSIITYCPIAKFVIAIFNVCAPSLVTL